MTLKYLDGHRAYYGFAAGARAVSDNRKLLNKINVFPVADGDTGNNLAATLNYGIEMSSPQQDVSQVFQSFSHTFLTGARGNSGLILAQFIKGIATEIGDIKLLTTQHFGEVIVKAVPYAYNAVSNPTEGTILTVMRDWAEAVFQLRHCNDFFQLFKTSLEAALSSLAATPDKLSVLKQAGVVDAGASGFVNFISGLTGALETGVNQAAATSDIKDKMDSDEPPSGITDRYCCEGLLVGEGLDLDALRQHLSSMGSSAVVSGDSSRARIHVHTNTPSTLFFSLLDFGVIIGQKVDDMQRQYDAVHNRKYDIALVTDSIADIPLQLCDKYQIHVLPINLNIGQSAFLDKLTISPEQLYQVMDTAEEYPTTSQPSVRDVESLFQFLDDNYKSIIAITVSKELSGTWNALNQEADRLRAQGKTVSVVNSRLNSGAQGLLVLKAAEEIATGKTHEQVVETVEQAIDSTRIYVSVSTLNYMVKGGRVSPMQGMLANILNMKPIASLDQEGRGISFAKAFSRRGNKRKIMQLVKDINSEQPVKKYAIVHAKASTLAKDFAGSVRDILGYDPEYIMEISSAVALNAGPGCVAVCLMSQAKD